MSNTQQPEALNLEEFRAKVTRAAREPLLARIAELEAVLSAMGEKGNPVEPADIPRATDQDTHFFLAGWNGRAAQVDPHEHFRNAAATAPAYPAEGVPSQTVPVGYVALAALTSRTHADDYAKCFATETALLENYPAAKVIAVFDHAATQPAAQGLDAETQRHAAIGKAIERACMDLPDGTEISVSLEKDAGTVTLIDQDGNEHENFSCDYGFAGVLNEAIDAAIAAQAKQGEQE